MMNSIISDRKKLDGTSTDVGPEGSDGGGYPINEIDDFRDSVLNILNENFQEKV